MLKALIAVFASAGLIASSANAQMVPTLSGVLKGAEATDGVTEFLGIPYAAPPVGENRWRAPQPPMPWSGERKADQYSADCAQAPFPPDAAPIRTKPAEDCLYLNVWKPTLATAKSKLPVMVWVHGGGFVNGGTSPAIYAGTSFARDGVVLVSLNYRLGRFGFFAHPALASEGFGGNFGFLDQIAALKWVKANIAAFGGDPANVTVFGESAGGMSMHMLLQAPEARGLFQKVIIQSGGGRDRTLPMPTIAIAAKAGEAFAPGLDAAALRKLPEAKVTGDLSMMTMAKPDYSGPMVDGRTIMGASLDAISAGLYANVPVIVGANSADGFPMVTDKEQIFAAYGEKAAQARKLHDPAGTETGLVVGTMTSADRMFIEPARAVARALAARGRATWLYRFGYAHPDLQKAMGGAPHASEIPYVFDTVGVREQHKMMPEEASVAKSAHDLWVAFARTGKPSDAWPTASASETKVMLIDANRASYVEDPYRTRLDFSEEFAVAK